MDQFYDYGASFLISGGLKSIVAPIERYRLIRQTQDLLTLQQKEKVFNILQYFKNQQFLSLWRGNITAILIWFPQVFSKLAFYENIKQSAHAPDLIFSSLSTALCGISTLLISYPFETARVRQATEIVYEKRVYSSLKESLYQIRQDSGTYKGLTFGILHTVNFALLINFINNQLTDLTSHSIEIAFLSSSLILYPIETLKKQVNRQTLLINLKNNSKMQMLANCMEEQVLILLKIFYYFLHWSQYNQANCHFLSQNNKAHYIENYIFLYKKMKQFEKLKSFSYDVLPVYTLVTTLTLQDQAIQFYINHPSFAKTNSNTILIFNKFKYKKYLAYLRFSTGYDETDEEIRITEWNRFPLTYENMGQFMFLEDCDNQQCDINQNNLSLNAQLVDQMVKIRFAITENQYHNYNLSLAQYYQLQTHLKKSLTLMSGWMIPHQFQSIKKSQI